MPKRVVHIARAQAFDISEIQAILNEYDLLAKDDASPVRCRTLARLLHDSLRKFLRGLAVGRMNEPLGEVDVAKRLRFLLLDYPELDQFTPLVKACKATRDKIEHHDDAAPRLSELSAWRADLDRFLARGTEAFNKRELLRERGDFLGISLEAMFETEIADKDRLANELKEDLQSKGLTESEATGCVAQFLSSYEEYADLHSLEEARRSEELILDTEAAIAHGAIFNAHLNGWNEARMEDIAAQMAHDVLLLRSKEPI